MKVQNNPFIKAVVTLISGSMIAQAITILASPLLSRLFTPEQQGVYTVLQSCIGMFSVILSLRYDIIIVSEPDERNVYSLVVLSSATCIITSVLVTIGSYVYLSIKQLEGIHLTVGIMFILLQSFLTGFINILTANNNRMKEYKTISSTYAVRTGVQNGLMLLSGVIGMGANGLLIGSTVGLLCGVGKQSKSLSIKIDRLQGVKWNDIRNIVLLHKKQALISTPAAFLNGFFYTAMNLLIEFLYGTHVLGLYSYSYRILALPITIISANISRVFYEQASKEWNDHGNFRSTYRQTVGIVTLVTIPIWIILTLFAPTIFRVVFGEQWIEAGTYVQLLITMYGFRLIAGSVNGASIIAGKQRYDLWIQLALSLSLIGITTLAQCLNWSVNRFFASINVISSIIYGVYILLFWICAKGTRIERNVKL